MQGRVAVGSCHVCRPNPPLVHCPFFRSHRTHEPASKSGRRSRKWRSDHERPCLPMRLDSRCSYVDATSSAVGLLGARRAWKICRASLRWSCRESNPHQRINAPPFAVVANRSRNYLRGSRLRCLLLTHSCHKFSLSHRHKRLIKDQLIRNDKRSLHPAATVKHRTTFEGRALETESHLPSGSRPCFSGGVKREARRLHLVAEARQYARNAHNP